MSTALDGATWPVILLIGALAGWFARNGWWWLVDASRDTAARTMSGFDAFGRFLGRLVLLGLVLAVGVMALAAIPHS